MSLFPEPQTREPTAERANPEPCTFPGMIGSSGAKSWVCGGCCHGDRAKPVEGRVLVILFLFDKAEK